MQAKIKSSNYINAAFLIDAKMFLPCHVIIKDCNDDILARHTIGFRWKMTVKFKDSLRSVFRQRRGNQIEIGAVLSLYNDGRVFEWPYRRDCNGEPTVTPLLAMATT